VADPPHGLLRCSRLGSTIPAFFARETARLNSFSVLNQDECDFYGLVALIPPRMPSPVLNDNILRPQVNLFAVVDLVMRTLADAKLMQNSFLHYFFR
jgi:hypothetical protein